MPDTKNDFQVLLRLRQYRREIIGLVGLALFLWAYWSWLDYRKFLKTPLEFPESEKTLVVEKGANLHVLSSRWLERGILKNQLYFKIYLKLNPQLTRLKAGEYELSSKMSVSELLQLLNSGQVIQYSFTIIPGQNYYQVLQNLTLQNNLEPLSTNNTLELAELLELNSSSIEGWLYPDTYYYSRGDSALSILRRASSRTRTLLDNLWQNKQADLPYATPYQALILASIIEKETGIASERSEIAGVFVRRLGLNMRLQTDPTIIYGIGPDFNGDITRKDMRTATPYNTYIIKGLTPTPIAMPSEEALYAAFHPRQGSYLYFVADGTGGHYFSDTLKEHNRAVQRMLKRQREQAN
jgi:UPF0755 protein